MSKITHTELLFSDLSELDEIPSDFMEPYIVKFFEYIFESVGCGYKSAKEAKEELKGLYHFVGLFCGVHSRLAINNAYHKIKEMQDEDFLEICKTICK